MLNDLEKVLKVEHSTKDHFTTSEAETIRSFLENDIIEKLFYTLTLDYVAMEDRIWDRPVSKEDADYLRSYYSAKRKALADIRADMESISKLVQESEEEKQDKPVLVDPYHINKNIDDPYFKDLTKENK